MRQLIVDGENQAIRCFLMLYGGNSGLTVGQMKNHMASSGYPLWPDWVADIDFPTKHLTKGAAQDWLRHLFDLENNGI